MLPPNLDFARQQEVGKTILAAGAAYALRTAKQTFQQFVEQRPAVESSKSVLPETALPPYHGPDVDALKSFFYSNEDRHALEESYKSDDESKSVLS